MARSYRARALAVMRQNETAMTALYAQLARDVAGIVQRRADADGNVPRQATFEIQQQAGDLVRRLFLGRNGRGEWAPFDTVGNGALIPLSPYMRQLWSAIRAAARIPVEQSAATLERRLPLDVLTVMRAADVNPFAAAKRGVAEFKDEVGRMKDEGTQGVPVAVSGFTSSFIPHPSSLVSEQLFRPNPLATYDAPHTWVDPNGYRLSDRVWNAAGNTRQRLAAYLETAIREGRGALQMSRELEQFLIPGRGLRTSKPYGANASFDGMRLARSEISRAAQEAHRMAATMNPFVSGMKWNLSARHPKIDICDDLARGGPAGDGVYSVEEYPERPHSQCLCYGTNVLISNPDSVLEELRADIRRVRADLVDKVGPLLVDQFEKLLLGQGLEVVSVGPVGRVIAPAVLPPTVAPVVVVAPPVIVAPPPPVDLAAQARRRILDIDNEYTERLADLGAQMSNISLKRLSKPNDKRLQQQFQSAFADEQRLIAERDRRIRQALYVERPAQVALSDLGGDPALARTWQRGMDEFNKLVSADVAPAQQARFIDTTNKRSSYNPDSKFVRMNTGADESTVVHEMGHWLEDHNPDLHRKVVAFYERRTQGYALEWMGPGFDRDELTRKDKFLDPYIGKEYVEGSDRYATEILSKGLEYFYGQAAHLAKDDPEMFDFIYNVVRGLP